MAIFISFNGNPCWMCNYFFPIKESKQKQANIFLGIPVLHSFLALLLGLSYFSSTDSFSLSFCIACFQTVSLTLFRLSYVTQIFRRREIQCNISIPFPWCQCPSASGTIPYLVFLKKRNLSGALGDSGR